LNLKLGIQNTKLVSDYIRPSQDSSLQFEFLDNLDSLVFQDEKEKITINKRVKQNSYSASNTK